MNTLDLLKPEHAYLFGFIQTDGNIHEGTQNRSKVSIEINIVDIEILHKFKAMLPIKSTIFERKRETNFGPSHTGGWRVCNREFTDELKYLGVPAGRKSEIICPPKVPFSKIDYFRGLIDGDGSVGVDKDGIPFIGFITKSKLLSEEYLAFISSITQTSFNSAKPNKRDMILSSSVYREHAQTIIKTLYYNGCISLNRKKEKATEALQWVRPVGMKRVERKKSWTPDQDEIVRNNSIEDAALILDRSLSSIKTRRWRLL